MESNSVQELGIRLEDFLNGASKKDREALRRFIIERMHRTLQQQFMRFIVELMEDYAHLGSGQYDQRNEGTVQLAKDFITKLVPRLPFI
jgi:hypothetical protein